MLDQRSSKDWQQLFRHRFVKERFFYYNVDQLISHLFADVKTSPTHNTPLSAARLLSLSSCRMRLDELRKLCRFLSQKLRVPTRLHIEPHERFGI